VLQTSTALYDNLQASSLDNEFKEIPRPRCWIAFPTYENPLDRYESFIAELPSLLHSDNGKRHSVVGPHPTTPSPLFPPSRTREDATPGPEGNCTRVLGLFYPEADRDG